MTKTWIRATGALLLAVAPACTDDPEPQPLDASVADAAEVDAGEADAAVVADAAAPDLGVDAGTGPAHVQTIDLGDVAISGGESAELTFELPANATTFTVTVAGPISAMLVVGRLDGPSGSIVSDDPANVTPIESFLLGPFAAQFKSNNRATGKEGLATALVPNNPDVTVSGGTYRMKLRGVDPSNGAPFTGSVQASVDYKTTTDAAGAIDVHLHLTGAAGLTAETAPSSQLLTDALNRLREIYVQANIQIGTVTYHDIDTRFQTMDVTTAELGPMFELSAGTGDGLHYFLIDRFTSNIPGGMVGGIAGGLPGPPLRPGTVASGVAVAMSISNDPNVIAHVMAHEGGHWLGLFHTSEITGTNDQLTDTPTGQQGQTHLMYPAIGGGQTISTSQADVMRRHLEVVPQ